MADIRVERKGSSIWPWIIGLIVLALLIWVLAELFGGDDDQLMETTVTPDTVAVVQEMPAAPIAAAPAATGIAVGPVLAGPENFVGQRLSGEARVAEVPTDRGFWIEDQGARIFVVFNDAPGEQPIDIEPGQTLQLSDALVHRGDDLSGIPGELDADTRRIAETQPAILAVDESNVEIVGPGTGYGM